jgi:RHS repeat-associated protein
VDTVTESFAYDRLDRVTQHANPLGSFSFSYLGQTRQLLSQQSGAVGTQWNYEDNSHDRRLKSITNSGLARGFQYATTPENQISTLTETAGGATQKSWHYAYDAADRLLSAQPSVGGSFSYGYDAADNLTSINGAMAHYNPVNQLASFNSETFSYDVNGNLKDDGIRRYQWDAENRLLSIGYKADAGKTTTFRYDGIGRRLAIMETNGGATTETRHLWCGDSLCQARTAGDVVTRHYYPEGVAIPQGGTLLYYGTDHLGSIRDVMAAQNGAKVASYDYDPYGNPIATSGRISVDFRYAGMFYHQQSGLYLTNFRAYDPKTGRWLSRDPIKEEGGLNLYSYAGRNPISYIDPTGLVRQLDPNGDECQQLKKKIQNKKADIEKRICQVEANPNKLPYLPPYSGAPPRASVQGHEDLIQNLKDSLAANEALYAAKCGGGGGGGDGTATAPVTTNTQGPNNNTAKDAAGLFAGAGIAYWIISEGLRVFPPRNLIPVP